MKLNKYQRSAIRLAEALASLGADIHIFESGTGKNGFYNPADGSMHIDIYAGNSGKGLMAYTISHEFTHFMEDQLGDKFNEFKELLFDELNISGEDIEAKINAEYDRLSAMEEYEGLSDTELKTLAESEFVAECCETIFTDTNAAERMAEKLQKTDKTLWEKVKEFFSNLLTKLKNLSKLMSAYEDVSPDSNIAVEVREMLKNTQSIAGMYSEMALESLRNFRNAEIKNTADNDSVKYSIRYTLDNKPVAVIDENILEGVPENKWVETVKNTISEKFSSGIPISGRLIKVNKISKNEFLNSKYTRHIKTANGTIYADKFKASNNLDDIVLASVNYINEDLNHDRKDKIKEFARGDVLLRVGENDYSAQVIVGLTSANNMVLYDVINFKSTKITLKKEDTHHTAVRHAMTQGSHRDSVPSMDSISDYTENVNSSNIKFSARIDNKADKGYNESCLSTENRAATNNRSSISWIYDAEIFSQTENKLFHEKISEINAGSEAFHKNTAGEYMLPIENKIVFTNGDFDAPYVSKIIEVLTEYGTEFDIVKELIYDVEEGKSGKREAVCVCEEMFGDGIAYEYKSQFRGVYDWSNGQRKGRTRREVINNYLRKQNGGRNDRKGEASEVKFSERTDRYSSESAQSQNYLREQNKILTEQVEILKKTLKEQASDLKKANARAEYFKGQTKRTKPPSYRVEDSVKFAKSLIKETSSTITADDISDSLLELTHYMYDSKADYTMEDLYERAVPIARKLDRTVANLQANGVKSTPY